MIWFNLALFAISFLVTALLAPKPDIENARAQEFDPETFPRATEDAPVPLLLGTARMRSPNTLWYGNFDTEELTDTVRTGLFSKSTVVLGHRYFLTLDMGLCLGPTANLEGIFIDSERVFGGTSTNPDDPVVEQLGSLGGIEAPPASKTIPPTFLGSVVDYAALNPDPQLVFDLLTIISPSQDVIDDLVLNGQLSAAISVVGANIGFLGFDPVRPVTIDVAFFKDDGAGNPDYSEEFGLGRFEEIADGRFSYDTVSTTIPPGTSGIRWVAFRFILGPAAIIDTYFDLIGSTPTGSPQLTVSLTHRFVEVFTADINEPNLFGGRESGGGWIGNFRFYRGAFDQPRDSHIASSVGSSNMVPAYRGTSHIVFENNEIGESPTLRSMEFLMSRFENRLGTSALGRAFLGSQDISPAEALYIMIEDDWSGLDVDPTSIDIQSFRDAAETLITEQNGVSLVVSSARSGNNVLREILRQIDGVFAQNQDGQVKLVLIRDDYDPATLTIYDEDDITGLSGYTQTSWRDVSSEVKVSFGNRNSDSGRVAVAQNQATLAMTGVRRTSEFSFPFCYSRTTANRLAARELARLSIPLIRFTMEMNRSGFQLAVGDVIKVSWSELGLVELIVRVQKVNLGTLLDNRVFVDVVQDVFAVSTAVFAEPADSSWVSDRPEPVEVTDVEVVEMPYFLSSRLAQPALDGEGAVIPFPGRPQTDSTGFVFNAEDQASDPLAFRDPGPVAYPIVGRLQGAYSQFAGFENGVDASGFTIGAVSGGEPQAAALVDLRAGEAGLIHMNGEWMGYEGVTDNGNDTFTLTNVHRGLLGTRALEHVDNSRLSILTTSLLGSGNISGVLAEDETVYYKILDQVGSEEFSPALIATPGSLALQSLADRPVRPRNFAIDGSRSQVPYDGSTNPTVNLTWVASNRAADQVAFETDAAEIPDQTEEYDFEVWEEGVQNVGLSQTNVTSPLSFDFSTLTQASGEFRLYSRRTGGNMRRSAEYAVYVFTRASLLLLSGDQQITGNDYLLISGDQQDTGIDGVELSGDQE